MRLVLGINGECNRRTAKEECRSKIYDKIEEKKNVLENTEMTEHEENGFASEIVRPSGYEVSRYADKDHSELKSRINRRGEDSGA
ncbi:hypothetical protein [[Clostridium] aminophilum]|uniref:hypothetical protein n=1 Tax=[Clostridium] aminophilum TaxID=1526 RepID=UPI001FA6DF93|nr:hypothetical protein [[Clostridium] aminophilum]